MDKCQQNTDKGIKTFLFASHLLNNLTSDAVDFGKKEAISLSATAS